MQLLRRLHLAHLVGDDIQLVLAGRQPIDRLVDVDVPASQRVGQLAQLAEGGVDAARVAGQDRAVVHQLAGVTGERAALAAEEARGEQRGGGHHDHQHDGRARRHRAVRLPFDDGSHRSTWG